MLVPCIAWTIAIIFSEILDLFLKLRPLTDIQNADQPIQELFQLSNPQKSALYTILIIHEERNEMRTRTRTRTIAHIFSVYIVSHDEHLEVQVRFLTFSDNNNENANNKVVLLLWPWTAYSAPFQ